MSHLLRGNRQHEASTADRPDLIHTVFEGTSEIQQLVIARAISGLRIE
jgi:hypothetical protein